jgi:hypothetical protein
MIDPEIRRLYNRALHMFKSSRLPANHPTIVKLTDTMADLMILRMQTKYPKKCATELAALAKKELDKLIREKKRKQVKHGRRQLSA